MLCYKTLVATLGLCWQEDHGDLTPTNLKLKKLLRKLPSLRCFIMMVLNEVPHGFISITEVKNEGFIWSSLSERWVTHPTDTM